MSQTPEPMETPEAMEPVRGEVWRVEFDPSRGSEIRKTRPAVVVNVATAGKLALRVVVPLTDWKAPFARAFWMVKVEPEAGNGVDKTSAADGFQVRSLSVDRFIEKRGELDAATVEKIARTVAEVLGAGSD